MGIISRIKTVWAPKRAELVTANTELATKGLGDNPMELMVEGVQGAGITGPQRINSTFSKGAAIGYFNEWVYAAITIRARQVALTPLGLYARREKAGYKPTYQQPRKPSTAEMKGLSEQGSRLRTKNIVPERDLVAIEDSNPIIDLLNRPNGYQNGYEFTLFRLANLFVFGDSYIWPERKTPDGPPVAFHVLPSYFMEPRYAKAGQSVTKSPIVEWKYTGIQGKELYIPADQVLHQKIGMNLRNQYMGMGLVEACFRSIMTQNAKYEMDVSTAFRQTFPSLVFFIKGADSTSLTRFEEQVGRKLVGPGKRGKILALDAEKAKMEQIATPPYEFGAPWGTVQTVAAVCGVPENLLVMAGTTEASSKVAHTFFLTNTANGDLHHDEYWLNESLLPTFGDAEDVALGYPRYLDNEKVAAETANLRTDVLEKWQAGVITLNEAREALDLEPADGGDKFNVQPMPSASSRERV